MRTAIYARYSSDNQRDASIEDQVRQCRARIETEGWALAGVYSDHATSGSSSLRPGYRKLLEDARTGAFDVVLAEALDRLSRDLEATASLYKQLSFAGVRLVTLAEGEISELHVGLKGTMNQLYLKDLAQKTRRGLEGRVRQGRSGGGRCYGYDVARQVAANGEAETGLRTVNEAEAAVVRRIFMEFGRGHSPHAIARSLNRDGIPGPRGTAWSPSTIHGNRQRGTGILNNELYVGRLVWNRLRYVKDPEYRQARVTPQSGKRLHTSIHDRCQSLRIIDRGPLGPGEDPPGRPWTQETDTPGRGRCGVLGPPNGRVSICCPKLVSVRDLWRRLFDPCRQGLSRWAAAMHRNKRHLRSSQAEHAAAIVLEEVLLDGLKDTAADIRN